MNKRSFLVVGLLFSMNGVYAGQVGTAADLESMKSIVNDIADEAARKYAENIVNEILSGNESAIDSSFSSIPKQFQGDKEKIFNYVLETLDERSSNEQRDVFAPAIAKKALVESHKEAILTPNPLLTRWECAKSWAWDNRETLQAVGVLALVFIAGRVTAPDNKFPTAAQNAAETRTTLTTGDNCLKIDIITAINEVKEAIIAAQDPGGSV